MRKRPGKLCDLNTQAAPTKLLLYNSDSQFQALKCSQDDQWYWEQILCAWCPSKANKKCSKLCEAPKGRHPFLSSLVVPVRPVWRAGRMDKWVLTHQGKQRQTLVRHVPPGSSVGSAAQIPSGSPGYWNLQLWWCQTHNAPLGKQAERDRESLECSPPHKPLSKFQAYEKILKDQWVYSFPLASSHKQQSQK